jgi:hypothetical protein
MEEKDHLECRHSLKMAEYKEKSCWEKTDNKSKNLNIPNSDQRSTQTQPKATLLDSDDTKPNSKKKPTIAAAVTIYRNKTLEAVDKAFKLEWQPAPSRQRRQRQRRKNDETRCYFRSTQHRRASEPNREAGPTP